MPSAEARRFVEEMIEMQRVIVRKMGPDPRPEDRELWNAIYASIDQLVRGRSQCK